MSYQSGKGGLTIAILILAALCVIDLIARKKEIEKAKLIGLARVVIEIITLGVLYIITIKNINNANSAVDFADAHICGSTDDLYMRQYRTYYDL